jgi:hypothetical protein
MISDRVIQIRVDRVWVVGNEFFAQSYLLVFIFVVQRMQCELR